MTGLSVLTIVRNRDAHFANLVEGLRRSSLRPAELVVVDMSDEPLIPASTDFPITMVRLETNGLPLAAARNRAVTAAAGDRLLFLDVDCIPLRDCLAIMGAALDEANSGPHRTPMDDDTLIGPWAVIVAADFAEPPTPEFDIDALPLWVPAEQAEGVALPPIVTAAPPSQTRMAYRLAHLIWRIQDGTLPACAIVGLDSPAEPILAAVERAGAGAVDFATFPLLAAPLWALSPAHRAEIAPKLPMLR